jgi:succinate dehydrogenase / fumarate reductase cytochrome b subunit
MSASATAPPLNRSVGFYEASIGKKLVMAVTGCILFLFVVGHLIGNLQVYLGPEALNAYARKLRDLGPLLWIVRGALLFSVLVHIVAGIQLWLANRAARPVGYFKRTWVEGSFSSRTMIVTGPLLAAFVLYHLLHLTWGTAHPDFNHELDVYANVVRGFQQAPASIAYIIAMVFLGFHLSHGIWSMFQSVGWNHPRYMPVIQRAAVVLAILIVAGNISIPVAVLAGIVR